MDIPARYKELAHAQRATRFVDQRVQAGMSEKPSSLRFPLNEAVGTSTVTSKVQCYLLVPLSPCYKNPLVSSIVWVFRLDC